MGEQIIKLTARPDEELDVVINEPVGGGYKWRVASADPTVDVQQKREPAAGGAVGAAKSLTLVMRPRQRGHHRVVMELSRPWEAMPAERRIIDIDVAD
jgi:predicted secreted protein